MNDVSLLQTWKYVFIFLWSWPFHLSSQSVGPLVDKTGEAKDGLAEVVPIAGLGFVTLIVDRPREPRSLQIRLFDLNERLLTERSLSLSNEGQPAQFEGAFRWGDRLTLLTSVYDPGPARNHLLLRQFRLPDLEEVVATKLDEAYTPRSLRIPFGYALSPDSTRLLTYGWSYSLPEDPVRLHLQVFDAQLQPVWSNNYLLPYRNETFYLYGCLLDRSGNAYLLGEDYQGNPSRYAQIDEQKIKQVALYAAPQLDKPREYAIRPGKLILSGVRFALDPSDQLVGVGFYHKKGKSRYEGLITLRIDGAADRLEHHLLPVNDSQFEQADVSGRGRGTFGDYTIDYLFASDSSLVVAGERIVEQQRSVSPYSFARAPSYAFEDIFVTRIRQDRYIEWIRRLPKQQSGDWNDLPKFSYQCLSRPEGLYFLFNNISNSRGQTRGNTQLFTVLPDGRIGEHDVTQAIRQRQPMTPQPARSWMLGRDRLLLYGVRTEKQQSSSFLVILPWSDLLSGWKN